MLKSDVLDLIDQGKGAKLEFKRDDLRPEQLAEAIVSFANMNGGTILLGVEDNGKVSGIQRSNLQEWLIDTVIRRYIDPPMIPDYQEITHEGKNIAVIDIHRGTAKPYGVRKGERLHYYLRMDATCQLAGREQRARLFQSGGLIAVEKMPVHGSSLEELDMRRLEDYFHTILGEPEVEDWQKKLLNRELLITDEWHKEASNTASYAGYVFFARKPRRRLPQAGTRLLVYPGSKEDYDANLDEVLDIPFVGLKETGRDFIEPSLPERVLSYLQPHISKEILESMQRRRHWDYPTEVIRELLINAFAHRDWTKQNDVRLIVFSDRLEVHSPGALPNGNTIEKIKEGQQTPRNTNIVRILRDYGFMDDRGMGIRRKVIPLTIEHTGREPKFEAPEDYFKVTLWKK